MKKSKIYTKTGDGGETGLVSGNRVKKSDLRLDLYGELDELNSRMGYATSLLAEDPQFKKILGFLHQIQSAIFDLGSNLACEVENREKYHLPQLSVDLIKELETEIDRMDSELEPLKNFILPGGSQASASLHLCRTGARTVERKLVNYHEVTKEELPINGSVFLNRLSDYLFVLARFVIKQQKGPEIFWKPQKS